MWTTHSLFEQHAEWLSRTNTVDGWTPHLMRASSIRSVHTVIGNLKSAAPCWSHLLWRFMSSVVVWLSCMRRLEEHSNSRWSFMRHQFISFRVHGVFLSSVNGLQRVVSASIGLYLYLFVMCRFLFSLPIWPNKFVFRYCCCLVPLQLLLVRIDWSGYLALSNLISVKRDIPVTVFKRFSQ